MAVRKLSDQARLEILQAQAAGKIEFLSQQVSHLTERELNALVLAIEGVTKLVIIIRTPI